MVSYWPAKTAEPRRVPLPGENELWLGAVAPCSKPQKQRSDRLRAVSWLRRARVVLLRQDSAASEHPIGVPALAQAGYLIEVEGIAVLPPKA